MLSGFRLLQFLVFACCGLTTVGAAAAEPPALRGPAELKALEAQVSLAIKTALPAIVAIDFPPPGATQGPKLDHIARSRGSGVIISPEGQILSQWHVSHQTRRDMPREPGDEIEVVLQDGRHLQAELLGADRLRDLSLLRIIQPGEYPFVPLAKPNSVRRGDPVLKLGHPYGYRASRGATARLGRVLFLGETIEIVADCLTFAGDSGGPLINLDGQVIGILEDAAAPQYGIWNLPERSGNLTCYTNVESIERLLPDLRNPDREKKSDPDVRVQDLPEYKERQSKRRGEIYGDMDAKVLPLDDWTQGENSRAIWTACSKQCSGSVVEVIQGDRRVAYGTVVDGDGWILTKASEIPDEPHCRLAGGRVIAARVAGVDPEYDLALLKVEVRGLCAVTWSPNKVRPAGKFVAAPDGSGGTIGVGIVSVEQRALEGPFPTTITKAKPYIPKPTPPEVLGKMVPGEGLLVRRVKDGAATAGIVPGDLLMSINGRPIIQHDDVDSSVENAAPGDRLSITLQREGKPVDISLQLGADPYVRCPGAIARYRNLRADDFPFVFEHDIPLTLDECGGPLIDLDGKVVGLTIARVAQHGCMAIPADVLGPLVQRLISK